MVPSCNCMAFGLYSALYSAHKRQLLRALVRADFVHVHLLAGLASIARADPGATLCGQF